MASEFLKVESAAACNLLERLATQTSRIGIVGLGYVGLPLADAVMRAGFRVTGLDTNPDRVVLLEAGRSGIGAVSDARLQEMSAAGFLASSDAALLAECDVIIICVPTPLNRYREPDLGFVRGSCETIAHHLRREQLIVLESTTYPGTCRDVMLPILEKSGLTGGEDFFLAYSPEREDPGNPRFHTALIPKVVGGMGQDATALAKAFYEQVVTETVPVSNTETAEAVKLTENIFRAVNIALANELKTIYTAMGVNVWEVIDAAATKPFGFMPFYPGPGLGGHCIPIDPFYLTWKAREYDIHTRFIELAGEINTEAPRRVVRRLMTALGKRHGQSLSGARILLIGMAYKKNVEDIRESPALTLTRLMEAQGAEVTYHDPHVPEIGPTREYPEYAGRRSVDLSPQTIRAADAVLICTDHDAIDYALIAENARLVIDTRNALKETIDRSNIVMA